MAKIINEPAMDFSKFINKPEIADRSPAIIRKLEEISYQAVRRLDEIERGQTMAAIKFKNARYKG